MKIGTAKKGMLVVVNDKIDATIYTISKIDDTGKGAYLTCRTNGIVCNAGFIDVSFLRTPTAKQLHVNGL